MLTRLVSLWAGQCISCITCCPFWSLLCIAVFFFYTPKAPTVVISYWNSVSWFELTSNSNVLIWGCCSFGFRCKKWRIRSDFPTEHHNDKEKFQYNSVIDVIVWASISRSPDMEFRHFFLTVWISIVSICLTVWIGMLELYLWICEYIIPQFSRKVLISCETNWPPLCDISISG